jgi:hypothetical protein
MEISFVHANYPKKDQLECLFVENISCFGKNLGPIHFGSTVLKICAILTLSGKQCCSTNSFPHAVAYETL